jgi:TMEM175 potassium channel family protein
MRTERLEAFTDGVMAILITVMVLEFRVPRTAELLALFGMYPTFLSYLLSFVYLGIYWNNHHHMFAVSQHVDGSVLWANLHLLFWLSMVPFVTAWMGENSFAATPVAVYGVVLLMAAIAYFILQRRILHLDGPESVLATAVGKDLKGKISPVLYLVAIPSAFISPWIAGAFYVIVALMWIVPDRRIEAVAPDLTDAAK